jgi:hypothetical protein
VNKHGIAAAQPAKERDRHSVWIDDGDVVRAGGGRNGEAAVDVGGRLRLADDDQPADARAIRIMVEHHAPNHSGRGPTATRLCVDGRRRQRGRDQEPGAP